MEWYTVKDDANHSCETAWAIQEEAELRNQDGRCQAAGIAVFFSGEVKVSQEVVPAGNA